MNSLNGFVSDYNWREEQRRKYREKRDRIKQLNKEKAKLNKV